MTYLKVVGAHPGSQRMMTAGGHVATVRDATLVTGNALNQPDKEDGLLDGLTDEFLRRRQAVGLPTLPEFCERYHVVEAE